MAKLTELILEGRYDNHLDLIEQTVDRRRAMISVAARPEPDEDIERDDDALTYGDIIRFSSRINPKYLSGLTATVVKFNPKTIVVDCPDDPRYRRFQGAKNIRCPKNVIEGRA